jgi:branched-chain amino acid transport system ATP-binding protein
LQVSPGEILTVLGHNGAGKTTLLKSIFGLVQSKGIVKIDGVLLDSSNPEIPVKSGLSFTPAESPVFRTLTVKENLELGAYLISDEDEKAHARERVLQLFPVLGERENSLAGEFSGGQQRMLAIGIALMSSPRLMLLDEPSLGIAPALIGDIFKRIRQICDTEGVSILLIEQNVKAALSIADKTAFLRDGAIILQESAAESRSRPHWWDLF